MLNRGIPSCVVSLTRTSTCSVSGDPVSPAERAQEIRRIGRHSGGWRRKRGSKKTAFSRIDNARRACILLRSQCFDSICRGTGSPWDAQNDKEKSPAVASEKSALQRSVLATQKRETKVKRLNCWRKLAASVHLSLLTEPHSGARSPSLKTIPSPPFGCLDQAVTVTLLSSDCDRMALIVTLRTWARLRGYCLLLPA